MISLEVLQDLNSRYFETLWPWCFVFVIFNFLIFWKPMTRFLWYYIALSWLFIGGAYFNVYFKEVHTYAHWIAGAFAFQAALMLFLYRKSVRPLEWRDQTTQRKIGLILFLVSAFMPFSLFVPSTLHSLFVFGWGPIQTIFGTIGLLLYSYESKRDILTFLLPIPLFLFLTLFV